jgi:uncharacterized repeat protein (TIGR01451 family)
MKSFLSSLRKLDSSDDVLRDRQDIKVTNQITSSRSAFVSKVAGQLTTSLLISSLALLVQQGSARSNPVPTPIQPTPLLPSRNILNGGFEQPAQSGPGAGAIVPEGYGTNPPIIWQTTEDTSPFANALEIWNGVNTGPGGPLAGASSGSQYAEINAASNGSIYQDVCMIPGETVNWSVRHAARISGQTNIMQASITNPTLWTGKTPPATQLYNSGNLTTSYSQGWLLKQGSWLNPTTSSVQTRRFAFRAIQGSQNNIGLGNFVDDVSLELSPIVDFLPTVTSENINLATTTEGNTTNNYYLSLRVNGTMQSAGTVQIALTGLSASRSFTLGSVLKGSATAAGLTATKSGNTITLNIPAGIYDPNVVNNYIHIPIDFSNTVPEPNDALTFSLSNPTGGGGLITPNGISLTIPNLSIVSSACLPTTRTTVSTTLIDDDTDRSDAPVSGTAPNSTGTNSYGEATHGVVAGIRLGTAIDGDTAAIDNANASGDGSDDDGISSFPTLTAGATSYSIPAANIAATGTGTLHAWIDFNKDGLFADSEYQNVSVTNGNVSGSLNWTGITVGSSGNTFARFRFTSSTLTDNTATTTTDERAVGLASDGEVEDYQVAIAAAPLACGTIFGSYNGGIFNSLRSYNPSSGVGSQIATLSTGTTNVSVAAIAVDPLLDNNGRRRVYYMDNTNTDARLFYYDGVNNANTGITLTAPSPTINTVRSDGSTGFLFNSFNRMGFAPDGTLYILDSQKTFYRFSPNRSGIGGSISPAITITDNPNNDIGNSGRAKVGQSGGGDIAFDNSGRMYIVTYDSDSSNIPTEFRLFQIINPQSSTPTAALLGREPSTDPVAGLAFQASDNTLYMQASGGKSFGWNLATNVITPLTTVTGSADLGSCTYPDLNPTGAFTKTVNNITNPGAKLLSANDILEYTLEVTNNGNLVAGNTTLVDAIPAGTTYVPGSTTLNGIAKADISGAMPYANAASPQLINSPNEASGVLTAGTTRKATVVFRVKVNASGAKICNQSNVFYDGSLPVGIFSDDPTTTAVADDETCAGVNKAKLVLVKRITAIKRNGETVPENFTTFVDDSTSTTPTINDNHCNWPGATGSAGACTNTYTIGKTSLPDVQSGDEIEYTIYYLNGGGNPAKLARVCDRLDANLTFQTQFDSNDPAMVGKGIALAEGNTTTQYLTNIGLDDKGQLTTPTTATSCNLGARVGSNLSNDVVVVDVGTIAAPLMNSTSAGTPTTSYGYIRFKAKVK